MAIWQSDNCACTEWYKRKNHLYLCAYSPKSGLLFCELQLLRKQKIRQMNDPDTVLNSRVHFVQRHHIFRIMIFDLHQVHDLAVGIFRQLHADLHIHPLVAAVGNKVDLFRVVLPDEHLIAFPIFLRFAAKISDIH